MQTYFNRNASRVILVFARRNRMHVQRDTATPRRTIFQEFYCLAISRRALAHASCSNHQIEGTALFLKPEASAFRLMGMIPVDGDSDGCRRCLARLRQAHAFFWLFGH
jgi:hypothetical protein